jgi:hypothetical protein
MYLRMEIDLALALRRTADRALAVIQQSAAGSAFGYVHVHAFDLLLVEPFTAGGFTAATGSRVPRTGASRSPRRE